MIKQLKKKINSSSGESISETLIALLISALALVMLAGAITASLRVVTRSRETMQMYYDADSEMVKMNGGTVCDPGVIISDASGSSLEQKCKVKYFKNDVLSQSPVVTYKYIKTEGAAP